MSAVFERSACQVHAAATGLVLCVLLASYWPTFLSIVSIWRQSNTFVHGFIVVPIVVFLIWRKRRSLRDVQVGIYWPAVLVLAALCAVWWLSEQLGIQVMSHLAVVAMIPTITIGMMGLAFAREIAFPLAYLLFAVPFGEALVPWLMDITASFTVQALQVSGIPVLRDGMYFSIPAGNFEVARACSGIRYLLATLALGTLYAHLYYRSVVKRIAFVILSLLLPILANGVRAFLIVLIAHFSEMRLAVGVDHLIFGWIFFGFVIALLFWIGHFFRDEEAIEGSRASAETQGAEFQSTTTPTGILVFALTSVLLLVLVPVASLGIRADATGTDQGSVMVPTAAADWRMLPRPQDDWRLSYIGTRAEAYATYSNGVAEVDVAIVRYSHHGQSAELANAENRAARKEFWDLDQETDIERHFGAESSFRAKSITARNPAGTRLIWFWYDVNGSRATNAFVVKLLEFRNLLAGHPIRSSAVAVSVLSDRAGEEDAETIMESFLAAFLEPVAHCLVDGARDPGCRPGIEPVREP